MRLTFYCNSYKLCLLKLGTLNKRKLFAVEKHGKQVVSHSLNAEVNAFIHDKETAQKLKQGFEKDLKDCYKLRLEDIQNRPWYIKVLCSIARLIAPIL